MRQKHQLIKLLLGLGLATAVETAAAERLLVHSEPVRAARVHASLKVNPSRGTAAVHISADHDAFGEEYNLYPKRVIKPVQGLTYNQETRELRFGKTLCGTVQQQSILGIEKHRLKETGACKLIKVESRKIVDNGFDDVRHQPMTDIHLHVTDG